MTLDNDMTCQTVDGDILILLVQEHSQLVPKGGQVASDLTNGG